MKSRKNLRLGIALEAVRMEPVAILSWELPLLVKSANTDPTRNPPAGAADCKDPEVQSLEKLSQYFHPKISTIYADGPLGKI